MGILDNVRARLRNNEERAFEEEFERAFRGGAWPEGVDDFVPLTNTGSFLPAEYDVDPLADASLPGNATDAHPVGAAHQTTSDADRADMVRRTSDTPAAVYAQPAQANPFQVIDASMRPRQASGLGAADPAATVQTEPVVRQSAGPASARRSDSQQWERSGGDDPVRGGRTTPVPQAAVRSRGEGVPNDDEGVQVFARQNGQRFAPTTPVAPSASKPFADRLRERVVAASAANAAAGRTAAHEGRPYGAVPASAPAPAPSYAPRGNGTTPAFAPERVIERVLEPEPRRQDGRALGIDRAPALASEPERASRRTVDLRECDQRPVDRDPEHMAERVVERIVERSSARGGYDRPTPAERTDRAVTPAERVDRASMPADRAPELAERTERRFDSERPYEQAAARPAPAPALRTAPAARPVSCIVLRPRNYDVVSEIAQGVVGERRPTVLVLRACNNELIRRILDFSFGLCCASGAGMREFGDRVYAVIPRGTALAEEDMVAMRRQGILKG